MNVFRHGLLVGKFYPPHLGHSRLIDHAARQCEHLTVLAMAAQSESIPVGERVTWLRDTHAATGNVEVLGAPCDAPFDLSSPTVWGTQVALMAAVLRQQGREPVDAVFSSEAYGDELAGRFYARHVAFDPGRGLVPISSSQVRADLAGHWDHLAAPTRAGLSTRAVFVGAESTGTTTIANLLARHYQRRGGPWRRTRCVAEFGREFTQAKWNEQRVRAAVADDVGPGLGALVWTPGDFDAIAAEQARREALAAAEGGPLVVCDTDAFATAIWERRYLRHEARTNQPWAARLLPRRDIYFVTSHEDVPWYDDGLREGDLSIRAAMTRWFEDALTAAGHSWVLLTGSVEQRLALSVRVTDRLLADRATFGPASSDLPDASVLR